MLSIKKVSHLLRKGSFSNKKFNRIIAVIVWILEIIMLVICERHTEASEAYNSAQKTSKTQVNVIDKEINSEESIYKMIFFSINHFESEGVFTISSEMENDADFYIDADDRDLLSMNTILRENVPFNDKMISLLGSERSWEYLLGKFIYVFDENDMWSYQIFGAYPVQLDNLKYIDDGNREEFDNYFNDLFSINNDSYHLRTDLQQQVLEDWHILSVYMPRSSEDGYVIQATLRSVTSL